ncbi:MAG: 8-oxo-dGTP pyrophosphatase MutT (NUDIX family) [Candidatus Saccharimonadales bacterium]|jgi:8-oxo-dGTP pyrophosphatase MutT (NUDIX family)
MLSTDVIQKALLITKDNELLVIRRGETDDRRPLQWDLPGGYLDKDEELDHGIIREIKEEVGIAVESVKTIYALTEHNKWDGGEANTVRMFYSARVEKQDIELSWEHDKYQWVKLVESVALFQHEPLIEALLYIIDNKVEL